MSSVGHVNTVKSIFKWEIDDFCVSCKEPMQGLNSPYFFANNVKWRMDLYPKAQTLTDKDCVSLYLTLLNSDKELTVGFSCAIINIKNERYNNLKSADRKFNKETPTWGWSKFIKTNELVEKKNNLLTNDKLTIVCEIIVDKTAYEEKEMIRSNLKRDERYKRLDNLQNFEKYFNNEKFSDVQIIVSEKSLYAHKNILANQSAVFAAMFEHNMKENIENKVSINDIDYDVFLELLRFLYTGNVHDMNKVVTRLVSAADMYELPALKDLCSEHLVESLTVKNVLEYLSLAERNNMTELKTKSIYFISTNADSIVKVIS